MQRISCKQFEDVGDTLDIVLFKSNSFGGTVQRFFTRHEYDHVAILLRFSNN